MNKVFARWREADLVWLPERGVGYLPVQDAPYDEAYFEKYEIYAKSPMGRAITDARVELTLKHQRYGVLVDVGIGCGAFVAARSHWVATKGFDVNPAGVRWLQQKKAWCDPTQEEVDAISFWDCLEHIPSPEAMLSNVRNFVFVSLPIVPGNGPPPLDWKHLRRDEHCWYFTRRGLIEWMGEHGFECIEHGTPESLLGREDIDTFVFRRRQ